MPEPRRRTRVLPVSAGTITTRATQLRSFKVIDARFPPGLRLPTHTHDTACISVTMEGDFNERLLRRDRLCSRGTVLAKPPLEPHDDAFGSSGARQLIIEIEPAALDTIAHGLLGAEVVHAHAADAETLARSLSRELGTADSAAPLALEGLTLELLACVWRSHYTRAQRRPAPWLLRARELLSDQFRLPLSVTQIALDVGVHPAHLAREFRTHYHESVGDYVRRLRVEWTKTQLLTTTEALACIAVSAGFSDQAHFTRWFKRQTGVTPHRYRSTR